ncbi:MAG: LptF/LptG family permease [Mangrovibacterium sp.]
MRKLWSILGLDILDRYILGKFLGTYFVSIALIISIAVVFDVAENVDKLLAVPMKEVLLDYYGNFIPYFANLFSPLFNFIAVIYFTSKMAYDSEIIAILSSGVSFNRFLRPYIVGASLIAVFSFVLGSWVIPNSTKGMNDFKDAHLRGASKKAQLGRNIHRQIEPGIYVYMRSYNVSNDMGYRFTLEHIEGGTLKSKLSAESIKWDREKELWTVSNYHIRTIDGENETMTSGEKLDTLLQMKPADYNVRNNMAEMLSNAALDKEIKSLRIRGILTTEFEVERHRRTAAPFASFVLTIIGVSLASRKVKGGLGLHLGLGILLSFTFLMFMQVTSVFAVSGIMPPFLAVWIPNITFGLLAVRLYIMAKR